MPPASPKASRKTVPNKSFGLVVIQPIAVHTPLLLLLHEIQAAFWLGSAIKSHVDWISGVVVGGVGVEAAQYPWLHEYGEQQAAVLEEHCDPALRQFCGLVWTHVQLVEVPLH
jgi:hypothetical protein